MLLPILGWRVMPRRVPDEQAVVLIGRYDWLIVAQLRFNRLQALALTL